MSCYNFFKNLLCNKRFGFLIFVLTFILSFCFVVYFQRYNILIPDDDIWGPYVFSFSNPVRHRFIGSEFCHFVVVSIPNLLGLHPNDVKPSFIAFFTSIIFCFTVAFLAYIPFFFVNIPKKQTFLFFSFKKIFDFDRISLLYTFIYIVLFLCLFNDVSPFYSSHILAFFDDSRVSVTKFYNFYFNILETVGFLEYIFNLFLFLPFYFFFHKFLFSDDNLSKFQKILFLLLSIILISSVEIINIPVFLLLTFILFFNKFFIFSKSKLYFFFFNYLVSFIFFLFYYSFYFIKSGTFALNGEISNVMNAPFSFSFILKSCFDFFVEHFYPSFILPNLGFIVLSVLSFLIAFYCSFSSKKYICFLFFSFLFVIGSYFSLSFISFHFWQQYLIADQYLTIVVFLLLVILIFSLSYLIFIISLDKKMFEIILFSIFFIFLFINSDSLIYGYLGRFTDSVYHLKNLRQNHYILEKELLSQIGNEYIYLPRVELGYYWMHNVMHKKFVYGNIFYNTKCIYYYNVDSENLKTQRLDKFPIFTDFYHYKNISYPDIPFSITFDDNSTCFDFN